MKRADLVGSLLGFETFMLGLELAKAAASARIDHLQVKPGP